MGKINVLSFEIANLIAAGEVVERPSSVLKELIENSIDAGATEIIAEIKRGGVALIRVSDNGCGIEKEDIPVALKRHATSKIKDKEDLAGIMTLGFRGEALAAISSVSEVTIITRTDSSECGYMLTSEGGNVIDISEVGAARGTTVVVENLFFNVPARRKFLKKDSTEAMNVAALVEKVALSRPDISIQLLIDGEERFKTPGDANLLNTIRAIFGKDFTSKLIKAEGVADGIKVSGYVSRSDNVRKNRNIENIFVNGRYVKSLTAQAALEKAYTSYIATEHFPCCVLFIEMNPAIVDVNVHPAKLEVKFSDERKVFEAVYYTVKKALEESEYRPELSFSSRKTDYNPRGAFVPIGEDTAGRQISLSATLGKADTGTKDTHTGTTSSSVGSSFFATDKPLSSLGSSCGTSTERKPSSAYSDTSRRDIASTPISVKSTAYDLPRSGGTELSARESVDLLEKYRSAKADGANTVVTEERVHQPSIKSEKSVAEELNSAAEAVEYKLVGEAFNCYIIIEKDNELLIIDKHAAHERIIFEDLKRSRNENSSLASQALLLPVTVILTPEEISLAENVKEEFQNVGFDFAVNGRSVDITAIPEALMPSDAEGLFVEMLGELTSGGGNPENTDHIRRERALYQVACKAAIKGGRLYDDNITEWIIKKVLALPDITVCPHGRPIAYKLKKSELDRQFDRIK